MLKESQEMSHHLDEKDEIINELELEIEEFTKNVQENMIKICDHEDIINGEISNL